MGPDVAEIMGPDVAEARSFACRTKALANRHIGDDPVPSGAAVFADLPPPLGCDRGFSYCVPSYAKANDREVKRRENCGCHRLPLQKV
jgi:hypothetical protein